MKNAGHWCTQCIDRQWVGGSGVTFVWLDFYKECKTKLYDCINPHYKKNVKFVIHRIVLKIQSYIQSCYTWTVAVAGPGVDAVEEAADVKRCLGPYHRWDRSWLGPLYNDHRPTQVHERRHALRDRWGLLTFFVFEIFFIGINFFSFIQVKP